MTALPDDARLLRLYVNESARWHGKALYRAIVEAAREFGAAGASVFRADVSYGETRRVHDARSEYGFVDVPVVVEVVDAPGRVDALTQHLAPMLAGVFATAEPVRVVHYEDHSSPDPAGGRGVSWD